MVKILARNSTNFLRNAVMMLAMTFGSQVVASDNIVSIVCNLERPDYLIFYDFDKSKGTVREKRNTGNATYSLGLWTNKIISWSSFEQDKPEACLQALDPQRMLLQYACFHQTQGVIAYSGTIGQRVMRCAYVK